jgi:hypothetical protein
MVWWRSLLGVHAIGEEIWPSAQRGARAAMRGMTSDSGREDWRYVQQEQNRYSSGRQQ